MEKKHKPLKWLIAILAVLGVLFLIIMLITVFQMRMQNKWVNYDQ